MTELISGFLNFLMGAVGKIIPDVSIPDTASDKVGDAVVTFNTVAELMNFLFPVKTLLTILGICVVVIVGKFAVLCVNWVIKRIRGG